MRARPREINIFNMSLLDILCGALGAFCFMMLVALPYYVVGTDTDRARNQKETENLLKDVEQLRERMTDPAQAEELRKMLDRLEAQIKQLQGQVNQYAYENQQLQEEKTRLASANDRLTNENASLTSEHNRLTSENQTLTAENQRLQVQHQFDLRELASHSPFLILATALDPTQDLSLFLEDEMIAGETDKSKFPNGTFDPNVLIQTGWEHDLTNISVPRHGVTLWISSTTRPKSSYRLFVRYVPRADDHTPFGRQRPTRVNLSFVGRFTGPTRESWIALAPERPWILAGTLKIDDKGEISYLAATEAERDDAWRSLMKSEVPTPAPTVTAASGLTREEMDRLRAQSQEERRRLDEVRQKAEAERERSQMPSPSAHP